MVDPVRICCTTLRDMFGPVADDARHSLTLVLDQHAVIRGDRELLTQLFSNLIENAIVMAPPHAHRNDPSRG